MPATDRIEQELQTLSDDAQEQYAAQVEQLSSSLKALSSTLQALEGDLSGASLAAVRDAIRSVGTAADTLASEISTTC